jgi:hypothetical protein
MDFGRCSAIADQFLVDWEAREVGGDRTLMFIIDGMLISGPLTVERFGELMMRS